MTEHSYFHNGFVRGDSTEAPYSAQLFQSVLDAIYTSSRTYGIVSGSSGFLISDLAVSSLGGMVVRVFPGAAFIGGVYFSNSAGYDITLDAGSAYGPRWDRIVIRVNWEDQTARLVIIKGEISSSPIVPVLQQDVGSVYEFPLARIFVPTLAAVLTQDIIYDERVLIQNAQSPPVINFMHNSTFSAAAMGYSGTPAYWWSTGTPVVSVTNATQRFPGPTRGHTIYVLSMGAAATLETELYTSSASTTLFTNQSAVTVAFYMQVVSGAVNVYLSGTAGTLANIVYPTAEPILMLLRTTASALNSSVALSFQGVSATTTNAFKISQVTISFGNIPAPFVPHKEIIIGGQYALPQTDIYSTGTFVKTVFLGPIFPISPIGGKEEIAAIIYRHEVYDSGSAGADAVYARLQTVSGAVYTGIEVGRLPNGVHKHSTGIAPAYDTNQRVVVVASGAGTLTNKLYAIGCFT